MIIFVDTQWERVCLEYEAKLFSTKALAGDQDTVLSPLLRRLLISPVTLSTVIIIYWLFDSSIVYKYLDCLCFWLIQTLIYECSCTGFLLHIGMTFSTDSQRGWFLLCPRRHLTSVDIYVCYNCKEWLLWMHKWVENRAVEKHPPIIRQPPKTIHQILPKISIMTWLRNLL